MTLLSSFSDSLWILATFLFCDLCGGNSSVFYFPCIAFHCLRRDASVFLSTETEHPLKVNNLTFSLRPCRRYFFIVIVFHSLKKRIESNSSFSFLFLILLPHTHFTREREGREGKMIRQDFSCLSVKRWERWRRKETQPAPVSWSKSMGKRKRWHQKE